MSRQLLTGKRRSLSAHCALLAGAAALILPASVFISATAHAQSATLPPVEVMQKKPKPAKTVKRRPRKTAPAAVEAPAPIAERQAPPSLSSAPASSTTVSGEAIADKAAVTNDTASLLSDAPGVSLYQAGGVSSLPVIHGMEDDRVKVMMNGMMIAPACGNHMNPPLSYMDPAQVKKIQVMAGVTPVSSGGDSIGGTIIVESAGPQFAAPGEGVITYGSASVYGRSNGNGISTSGTVSAATSNVNLTYTGAWSRADDYKDGNGDKVKSTLYEAQNHMLSLAARKNGDLFVLDAGVQHIPYQGFVNQYMDMTDNTAWFVNGRYAGDFSWGKLDVRAYYQNTKHEMDFLADKGGTTNGGMPMNTDGTNVGYSVKAEIPLSRRDTLRVGNEFHAFMLDDWWPPIDPAFGKPGMSGPMSFLNINGGERDQLGTFLEWEAKWSRQWTTLLGARNDVVWMDTGDVHGYNTWVFDPTTDQTQPQNKPMPRNYVYDAALFNAKDHARTDVNFDVTALSRYEANSRTTLEAGYAMKTRSPNLYERYAWSSSIMGLKMNGWFGDGNGHLGNLDLEPETAHTFSVTAGWHDSARKEWELKITPYYTYVVDYIDVNRCYLPGTPNSTQMMVPLCNMGNRTVKNNFVALQFANHDAEIYGADISARMPLGYSSTFGRFGLAGVIGFVHGTNLDTGDNLYRMMPLNAKLTLNHKLGNWSNAAELQLVDDKTNVERVRNEVPTPGYALVNLRTSYQWGQIRFDGGVENVFDKQYYSPMAGAYLGDTANRAWGNPVAGIGRSFYAGVTVKF